MKGKGRPKISDKLKSDVINWIKHCDYVRTSPFVNDTLLVNGERVPKLLLEMSITRLHAKLAMSKVDGILDENKVMMVGESSLRNILKKDLPNL